MYGLDFTYDAAGRRRSLSHPDAIDACTSARCVQQYGYHTVTGTLDTLLDRGSYTHTFAYDAAGRMVQKVSPGSVTETLAYDSDDRLIRRAVGSMIADTLTLDAAGRAAVVRGAYPAVNPAALSYNGLGALVASTDLSGASSYEDFTVDGLGNRRFAARPSSRTRGHADGNRMRIHAYDGAGRMTSTSDSLTVPSLSSQYDFVRAQVFDDAGNLLWRGEREFDYAASENRYDHLLNYYGADDKLAVANRHIGVSPVSDDSRPGARGVWEMYRDDALGRRVQTYSVRGSACPSTATECASYFERTVWDGDQLLYEIRTPVASPTNDLAGGGTYGSFGRVAYLHGGGIDAPLAVTRFDEAGQPAVQTLAPHANWQGDYVDGTTMSGGAVATCTGASGCPRLEWRGGKETADGAATAPGDYPWWGRLVVGQLDGSGLKYQRNRFYDPLTGQFTQADPIGLAGGKNLYAFAGGDPVNYTDPFGLCPEIVSCAVAIASGTGALVSASTALVGTTATVAVAGAGVLANAAAMQGSYFVYRSVSAGKAYFGITNDIARRGREHLNGTKAMRISEMLDGLTKEEARGVEQVLIEARGLQKNGGDLLNKINSISPSAENYERLKARGLEILQKAGIDPNRKQ